MSRIRRKITWLRTSIGDNQVTIRSMGPAVILKMVWVGVIWMFVKTVSLRLLGVVDGPSHLYVVVLSTSMWPAHPRLAYFQSKLRRGYFEVK